MRLHLITKLRLGFRNLANIALCNRDKCQTVNQTDIFVIRCAPSCFHRLKLSNLLGFASRLVTAETKIPAVTSTYDRMDFIVGSWPESDG